MKRTDLPCPPNTLVRCLAAAFSTAGLVLPGVVAASALDAVPIRSAPVSAVVRFAAPDSAIRAATTHEHPRAAPATAAADPAFANSRVSGDLGVHPQLLATPLARTEAGRLAARADPDRPASTWPVTNCNDDGAGSLRYVVDHLATSGDTVSLDGLACDRIETTSYSIVIPQDTLTIQGPGADRMTIASVIANRVLVHSGYGTLTLSGVTIADGRFPASTVASLGGCIASLGSVDLEDSIVTGCRAETTGSPYDLTKGGGVYTFGDLTLRNSRITDSYVGAHSGLRARGGGAYVHGSMVMKYSSIDYNTAGPRGIAGGAWVAGNGGFLGTYLANSSINGNQAYAVGALLLAPGSATPNVTITNSTIADNSVAQFIGGIKDYVPLHIYSSTISGNSAGLLTDPNTGDPIDSGLFFANATVTLQSTLMAGNRAAGQPADISKYSTSGSVDGADNLILAADCVVPADTIEGVDPLLGDLDPHGGPTPTVDLLPGSPAIDAGNNAGTASYDQRGAGFPRVVGASADIGAFETSPVVLSVSPEGIDFGVVAVGATEEETVTLTNAGSLQTTITTLTEPEPPFFGDFGNCGVPPFELPPGFSCHLHYRFTPTEPGYFTEVVAIIFNGGNFNLGMVGTGVGDIIFADGFDP